MADGEVCQHSVTTREGRNLSCGQVHDPRKCKGHKNIHEVEGDRDSPIIDLRPCRASPVNGLKVCVAHGGRSPNAKAKAAKVVTEQNARKKLGRLTVVPIEDPLTYLQILGGKAAAWMDVCEEHMAELERMRYGTESGEHIRGEVQLFVGALDQCRKVLVDIARLNIDQRLAAIEEEKLNLVTDALGRTLQDMGFSPDQQREARLGLVRHLRVIPRRPAGGTRPAA